VRPVPLIALLRRRLNPWVLPATAIGSIAASGADRSPMFFPGLTLVAIGGGKVGRTRLRSPRQLASLTLGTAVSSSYLMVVLIAARRRGDGLSPSLLWSLGMVPAFAVSAPLGGELGDLALSLRRLERMRARDRGALAAASGRRLGGLRDLSNRISGTAMDLEQTLLRIASANRSGPDRPPSEVELAVATIRSKLRHDALAPLLIAAANDEPLDLVQTLDGMLNVYREGWREENITIPLTCDLASGTTISARSTGALLRAAKVALDNSYKHQRPGRLTRVTVSASVNQGSVTVTLTDDGGAASKPAPERWGTGLREINDLIRGLGGRIELELAERGLRIALTLPQHPVPTARLGASIPVARRVDETIGVCGAMMRPVVWIGGLSCLMTTSNRKLGAAYCAAFSALVALDRAWEQRASDDRRRPRLMLALISALWPADARPAQGWTGLELVLQGARADNRELAKQATLTVAASALAAGRAGRRLTPARLADNILFPLASAICGYIAGFARQRLALAENEVLGLRERAQMIERLARSIGYRHDIIKNLRASDAWYDDGIMESPDGQRLVQLCGEIDDLERELLGSIAVADPIRDFHEHLRLRLDPATVVIAGEQPIFVEDDSDREGRAVKRAREHIGVVAVADEIADRILIRFPPRLSGRPRLERLHVQISPFNEHEMKVSVRPIPAGAQPESDLGALVSALAQVAGDLIDGYEDGGFTFTIPATALRTQ